MRIVCIAGGIGSGKSVVARIMDAMGYPVYDCDSKAKNLMDTSIEIKRKLYDIFGPEIVTDGCINRSKLAEEVFSDDKKLDSLNKIVHASVRKDITDWIENLKTNKKIAFIETAIPVTSGIDRIVDDIWWIESPLSLRSERVINERKMKEQDFLNRVASQKEEKPKNNTTIIFNDEAHFLLNQILHKIHLESK